MIEIRLEQMAKFNELSVQRFEFRMRQHLRDDYPDQTKGRDDGQLVEFVRAGIERAQSHGIEFEKDIEVFLDYLAVYGRSFGQTDETSWAGEILKRGEMTGEQKIDALQAHDEGLVPEEEE